MKSPRPVDFEPDAQTCIAFEIWCGECVREFADLARGRVLVTGSRPRRYYPCRRWTVQAMLAALRANKATIRSSAKHRLIAWGEWLLDRLHELDAASPPRRGELRCVLCQRVEHFPKQAFAFHPRYVNPTASPCRMRRGAFEGRVLARGLPLCQRCDQDSNPIPIR